MYTRQTIQNEQKTKNSLKMDFAVGTWNLTGTENFDEYMKTIGNAYYSYFYHTERDSLVFLVSPI